MNANLVIQEISREMEEKMRLVSIVSEVMLLSGVDTEAVESFKKWDTETNTTETIFEMQRAFHRALDRVKGDIDNLNSRLGELKTTEITVD